VIQTTGGDHQGLWGMLAGIVRNEGWLSLYQGVWCSEMWHVNCDTGRSGVWHHELPFGYLTKPWKITIFQ